MPYQSIVDVEIERVRAAFGTAARELGAARTALTDASGLLLATTAADASVERAARTAAGEVTGLTTLSEDCVRATGRHLTEVADEG